MASDNSHKNEWFDAFYLRHYKLVYRICRSYMSDSAEAEDCTEDVFVKVLTGNYIFNDETHEKKWLVVTAMNLCKDRLKRWWKRKVVLTDEPIFESQSDDSKTDSKAILDAINKLSPKYKDVIFLHYYMNYKTDEIAAMLHTPPSTVRNRLVKARDLLKKEIGEFEYE